jgi:hypothetical protein
MSAPDGARHAARIALRLAGWALAGLLVVSFAFYVWPTRWRYDHMTDQGETLIVRIDRVTGDAEVLLPDQGWVPVADEDGGGPDGGSNGI